MKPKSVLSAITAVTTCFSLGLPLAACNSDDESWTPPKNTYVYNVPQDYCRTYYEIFTRSFADGNGDGIGDFRGLINNLDYLNDGDDSTMTDLGINGIWLMPINKSSSYHKYDVVDYFDVDDEYGTMEDFDELAEECLKRGIWLQMDLVINHTSSSNRWFLEAVKEARYGLTAENSRYLKYYDVKIQSDSPGEGWHRISGASGYWYYGSFSANMPELDLRNFETNGLKDEISLIVDYWLAHGVKSFRLDAVPWACATSVSYNADNEKFWTWFNDYCDRHGAEVAADQGWANDGISRYCYNVGEVWGDGVTISKFFKTGMSNFNYAMGGSSNTAFVNTANGFNAFGAVSFTEGFINVRNAALEQDPNAMLSNFLSNHDNSRSGGFLFNDPVRIKKAAALYMLVPGNPYIYYGEELGAEGMRKIGDNEVDPNVRLPFNWGDTSKGLTTDPPGVVYNESFTGKQRNGSWKSQTNNKNSILTYYRNAIALRNRFPEIGRGDITPYAVNKNGGLETVSKVRQDNDLAAGYSLLPVNTLNKNICAYMLTWQGSSVLIVHNVGDGKATLDMSGLPGYNVVGELKAKGGSVSLKNGSLTLSGATVAVLQK